MSDVIVAALSDYGAMRRMGVACGLEDSGHDDHGILAAWGAYDGARLVGVIALELSNALVTVNWMAVDEGFRRRGIGRRLYEALEEEAHTRGIGQLWVTARDPAFFSARGFTPVDDEQVAGRLLGECPSCRQYGHECEPRALTKRIRRPGPAGPG